MSDAPDPMLEAAREHVETVVRIDGKLAEFLADFARAQVEKAVEEEREACAKICDNYYAGTPLAQEIRARGEGGK